MKRKFLCLLLALTMVLGLAATVSASEDRITSGDWVYQVVRGEAVIVDYNGTDAHVVVPAKIDGYTVTEIGTSFLVFSDAAKTMTSVTVSEGIEIINPRAFMNCTALKKVVLPGTVSYIGSSAFEGCTSLSDVTLSEGLETIHRYAFLNTALTSIFIPTSVTELDEDSVGYTGEWGDTDQVDGFTIYGYTGTAAQEYARYWHFNFVDMGANYDNSGRCGDSASWEYTAATGTLHIYGHGGRMYEYDEVDQVPWFIHMPFITNAVIEDVLDICNNAFHGCAELTTVTMTDSVKYIRTCAFMDTPKLTSVKLSDSLTEIGFFTFSNSGLTSIELPDSLTDIEGNAFRNTPLTSIVIPDSVTFLGQGAFLGCTKLSSVKLPAELDEIYPQLFEDCISLKSIDLPETIIVIGRQAFSGSGLTSIEIPEGVVAIDSRAFAQCENLKYLNLPAALEELYEECFIDCPNLSAIAFRSNAPYFCETTFQDTTLTAYYPADNATWTEEVRQNYGGTITWIPYEVLPFTDVRVNSYCYEPIGWAVQKGITYGITDTEFSPDASCKRSQVVTFLWRAAGSPEPETTEHSFVDVKKGSFYEKAVLWAVENGITVGTDDAHFGPDLPCTRAQVVTFLWRAAGKPAASGEIPFEDVPAGKWYADPIRWAVENGITFGMTDTEFGTDGTCTRGQVVTFLYRVYN